MDVFQNDVLDMVEGEGDAVRGMDDEDLQAIVAGEIDKAAMAALNAIKNGDEADGISPEMSWPSLR